jgi:hypothetical protein
MLFAAGFLNLKPMPAAQTTNNPQGALAGAEPANETGGLLTRASGMPSGYYAIVANSGINFTPNVNAGLFAPDKWDSGFTDSMLVVFSGGGGGSYTYPVPAYDNRVTSYLEAARKNSLKKRASAAKAAYIHKIFAL